MSASDSWAPVTSSRVDPIDPRWKPRGKLQASAGAGGRNHAQETGLPHRSGPASCQAIGGQTMTLLFGKQHAQDRIEWRVFVRLGEDDRAAAGCSRESGWTPAPRRGG